MEDQKPPSYDEDSAAPAPVVQAPVPQVEQSEVEQGPAGPLLILADAEEAEVCFDSKKEMCFKTCVCQCGGGIEMTRSGVETLETGCDIKIYRNFNKTKFEISVDGGEPKYKLIKKKMTLPLLSTWHIYTGPNLDDRICTIRDLCNAQVKVYFYEKPYPKRSDPTDHKHLHSVIQSRAILLGNPEMYEDTGATSDANTWRKLKGFSKHDGTPLFAVSKSNCGLRATVEPGVDYLLVTAIMLVWFQSAPNRPSSGGGSRGGTGRGGHHGGHGTHHKTQAQKRQQQKRQQKRRH